MRNNKIDDASNPFEETLLTSYNDLLFATMLRNFSRFIENTPLFSIHSNEPFSYKPNKN